MASSTSATLIEDYYAILEVPIQASKEVIRESYKRLALRCHPDKCQGDKGEATRRFQRLVRAWEVLGDSRRRTEYDIGWREREGDRRREEQQSRPEWRWGEGMSWNTASNKKSKVDQERIRRAKAWKIIVRNDYLQRLDTWISYRDSQVRMIRACEQLVRNHEHDLQNQDLEDPTAKFRQAIERSRAAGRIIAEGSECVLLGKLMEAQQQYIKDLLLAITEAQSKLSELTKDLQQKRQEYEIAEEKARKDRVREALDILGPRELNPPLFTMIDRRGQAINTWKSLSRIKTPTLFSLSPEMLLENPWHADGSWERMVGEYTCSRCAESTFQLLAECAAAACPGCKEVVCNHCCRELGLLREYENWVLGEEEDAMESLFEVGFESGARVRGEGGMRDGFVMAYGVSHM